MLKTDEEDMSNLKLEEKEPELKEKTRQELYVDQIRLREEQKKRQQETFEQERHLQLLQDEKRNNSIKERQMRIDSATKKEPVPPAATAVVKDDDDDIIIDEEMTNKNICIGMVNTDIVVEKSPLILIRDEQFEIVSLESEGKLSDNYCKL